MKTMKFWSAIVFASGVLISCQQEELTSERADVTPPVLAPTEQVEMINSRIMKLTLVILLCICSVFGAVAQESEKKVRFEFGWNTNVGLEEQGGQYNEIGMYMQIWKQLPGSRLSADVKLSVENYTSLFKKYDPLGGYDIEEYKSAYSAQGISLIASGNYHYLQKSKTNAYVGLGAGFSFDEPSGKVLIDNRTALHFAVVPKVGISFGRIHFSSQYYWTYNQPMQHFARRVVANLGYRF